MLVLRQSFPSDIKARSSFLWRVIVVLILFDRQLPVDLLTSTSGIRMKARFSKMAAACLYVGTGVEGYNTNQKESTYSRRNLLASAALTATTALMAPRQVLASDDDVLTPLYFGVGVRDI